MDEPEVLELEEDTRPLFETVLPGVATLPEFVLVDEETVGLDILEVGRDESTGEPEEALPTVAKLETGFLV